MDKDDAESLCSHIEGHVGFAREAIAGNDAHRLRDQAIEIKGWAQALQEVAEAAAKDQP